MSDTTDTPGDVSVPIQIGVLAVLVVGVVVLVPVGLVVAGVRYGWERIRKARAGAFDRSGL